MATPLRTLILAAKNSDVQLLLGQLRCADYVAKWRHVTSEQSYIQQLYHNEFDLVLVVTSFQQFEPLSVLHHFHTRGVMAPVIIISDGHTDGIGAKTTSAEMAVACMKQGAADFLFKDQLTQLGEAVTQALKRTSTYVLDRNHVQEQKQYAQLITDLRRHNDELLQKHSQLVEQVTEQTTELRDANMALANAKRAKDEFLAIMSHELRTPLNTILGNCELLQEGIHGSLNDDQKNSVKTISSGGHRLLSVVNDILDMVRIETGEIELYLQSIPVDYVCKSSLQTVSQMATEKSIKTLCSIDPNIKLFKADMTRLKQMLVNLLNNAIKFTSHGGRIGLEVFGEQLQDEVHFTVWDTGIGIHESNIDDLFQPFMQVDSSFSREQEGAGLGLSLVWKLAKMHGGRVNVESKLGRGSRFTVVLPWQQEVESASHSWIQEPEFAAMVLS